mmetsp:Transcript_63318/g.182125  ORF Transcript_63318/g.182125 Transcript_63318/m.182125 type:complete len:307 (+) Transcript_63318:532-1452(+)
MQPGEPCGCGWSTRSRRSRTPAMCCAVATRTASPCISSKRGSGLRPTLSCRCTLVSCRAPWRSSRRGRARGMRLGKAGRVARRARARAQASPKASPRASAAIAATKPSSAGFSNAAIARKAIVVPSPMESASFGVRRPLRPRPEARAAIRAAARGAARAAAITRPGYAGISRTAPAMLETLAGSRTERRSCASHRRGQLLHPAALRWRSPSLGTVDGLAARPKRTHRSKAPCRSTTSATSVRSGCKTAIAAAARIAPSPMARRTSAGRPVTRPRHRRTPRPARAALTMMRAGPPGTGPSPTSAAMG